MLKKLYQEKEVESFYDSTSFKQFAFAVVGTTLMIATGVAPKLKLPISHSEEPLTPMMKSNYSTSVSTVLPMLLSNPYPMQVVLKPMVQ